MAVGLVGMMSAAVPLTVHEWGTFTTVSASDGTLLPGLEREEEALPNFVHSHAGFAPANKGLDRPVLNVTVKMETPVLYFYAPQAMLVTVDVGFRGGSISQWYPDRAGGETLPPLPAFSPTGPSLASRLVPIDFATGYNGSASWAIDVLAPATTEKISAPLELETAQWPRARVASANRVRGPSREVEGFVFYRGIGNFSLPLEIKSTADGLVLNNRGAEAIPFAFVYEKRATSPQGMIRWSGALGAAATESIPLVGHSERSEAAPGFLGGEFPNALIKAGLNAAEARALLATWRESYFEREGLRVFWIVPRAFTDRVLPISIAPQPEKLERVLVGRSEVLTPQFEQVVRRDFAADGGKRWQEDRFALAYRARAQQLGVVLAATQP